MKKKYFLPLLTALITVLFLFACNKEESPDINPETNKKEVKFSSSILEITRTRAINNIWEDNDEIGVYMIHHGFALLETSISEHATNRRYHTTGGSTFSAYNDENKIYYPTDGSNVDFIAYHPYKETINDYFYPVNVTTQTTGTDLLYSDNAVNLNQTSAPAALIFNHQLNKLVVNITTGDGLTDEDLEGVIATIQGMPTTANFNLADKTISNKNGTSSPISMIVNAEGTSAAAIIIPHESVSGETITFQLQSGDTYTYNIPAETKFKDDQIYTFDLTLFIQDDRVQAEMSASIMDWTNTDGIAATVEKDFIVKEAIELKYNGYYGSVKVSNPVFSPDGKTAYIPTSTPNGHLFAVDIEKGTVKWAFPISTATYGGGATVGADGIIYQCGTDSKVYAINPNGTPEWTSDVDGVIGAFPALSADGVLFCATNSGTLYALYTANGFVKWSKSTGGTSSAVAVDASGNVYAGTNTAIYKFDASGTELWNTIESNAGQAYDGTLNVTERGAFAMNVEGTVLYATLKSNAGLAAIDMATGVVDWIYTNIGGGDAYFPIVGSDGTIYFNEKGATSKRVYAINSNGTPKWEQELGVSMTYCGLVMANNGKIYCGTSGKTDNVYKLCELDADTGDFDFIYDRDEQIMAAASIGPDQRLYIGTVGTSNRGSLLAIPIGADLETSSWSTRGGNRFGTNGK